ncbi:restriction endonuclease subunit S [Clostridium beijerinckii]|uniref:Type I restriction enzyme S subunit n=1 Tax=Clostridium beijerinckii TaxID=1520 RepID=A0AAE5H563_CLOBE|nr:restriction endonuclease subunit S [Clostridium beijerinckii]ALB45689.1 restriction endonuclease subunit S [Clostridium beijerinckii NRRL B-598]NSB14210.1 type I restriction enzyme S subunit [Clostridium beijerinckii]
MNMMLEQFKTIFDRPEKVKKLREVILDLAVRGKLVEQDPSDESASILLERIREEKKRLIKEKKIKSEKPLADIEDDEKPYELPKGWEFTRMRNLSENIHYGYTASATTTDTFVKFLRITDIQNNMVNWDTVPYCEIDDTKLNSCKLKKNDILIARTGGTIGKSFIVKNVEYTAVFASYLIRVIPLTRSYPDYLKLFLETPLYWKQLIEKSQGTGQPNVNAVSLSELIMPLPPLREQKRIVEKVDSLMLFCDMLEKALEKKVKYGSLSAKSVFNSIGNVNSIEELEESLKFIMANFKDLTLGDNAIKELKNAILQLAIQGKLVTQNPDDEPASVLLERILEEKERLIKEKKIKREKALMEISEDEKPFELPIGWKWSYINEIAFVTKLAGFEYTKYLSSSITNNGDVPIVRAQNIKMNNFIDNTKEFISFELSEKLNRSALYKKCILITFIGAGIGEAAIFDNVNRYHLAPNVAKMEVFNNFYMNIDEKYVLYYIMSSIGQKDIFRFLKATAQPSLSMETIRKVRIPIPPLEEQKRIVEKVDSLMQLCDELETKIEKSKKYSEKLMESILKSSFLA